MKGSIQTALRCAICGLRLKSVEPRGLLCPAHQDIIVEGKCRVMFDNVTTRFDTYKEAYKVLTRKRAEVDAGTYDARDYKIKAKPLAFNRLAVEWLATYISIRPSEMLSLTERQVDRRRGLLIIPHPKERKPKIVPLLETDLKLLRDFPEEHPSLPFFRHESNAPNGVAGLPLGQKRLYQDWKRACRNLGVEDVDLYGGTKHSTAMGLRAVATFEEVRKMTGHTTNKAFDRYLQLEGEKMRELYARREALAISTVSDNGLTMDLGGVKSAKIEYYQ